MLIQKIDPTGVDVVIQRFQELLHDRLLTQWDIDSADYKCYSRCYRNKKADKYIAENYEGGKEYKPVYWDDTKYAVSFFGLSANEKHEELERVNVHLVFFVNLSMLKPDVLHRADEEVRKDVQAFAIPGPFNVEYKSTDIWLANCLREYNGSAESLESKIDMHPIHCFRLNLELLYDKNICP